MELLIETCPKRIWHRDCPENKYKSGIVQQLGRGDTSDPVKCLHCGQEGEIPHGTPFGVTFKV